jgi:hypothetical protein
VKVSPENEPVPDVTGAAGDRGSGFPPKVALIDDEAAKSDPERPTVCPTAPLVTVVAIPGTTAKGEPTEALNVPPSDACTV